MRKMTPDEVRAEIASGQTVGPVYVEEALYHNMTDFVSSSILKKMNRTPSKFLWEMDKSWVSPAMALGSAIHMAILEPDRFAAAYRQRREKPIEPERPEHLKEVTRRSIAGKQALDDWEATWRGEYQADLERYEQDKSSARSLSSEDANTIERVRARILDKFGNYFGRQPDGSCLDDSIPECSFFATDQETGMGIRGRLDLFLPERNLIVDLKTTDTADQHLFTKTIFSYGYHVQAAIYCDLVFQATGNMPRYVIIAAEKTMDCDAREFDLSKNPAVLEIGRSTYRRQLRNFVRCKRSNEWMGYPVEPVEVTVPRWVEEGNPEDEPW